MFRIWVDIAVACLKLGMGGASFRAQEKEVVDRRGWVSRERFEDFAEAARLLPAPNRVVLAMVLGRVRGGWIGLCVAGLCVVVPAVALSTACAWAYLHFGALPVVAAMLYGTKPVVPAILLGVTYRLGRRAATDWRLAFLGVAVMLVSLTEFSAVPALLGGGVVGMFWLRARAMGDGQGALLLPAFGLSMVAGAPMVGLSLWTMGAFFAAMGAILFGSGYLLVAFVQEILVYRYGWLSYDHVLDAVAIGQLIPGSIVLIAPFVGFLATGGKCLGALIAAGAVFAPVFVFAAALLPLMSNMQQSAWVRAFLDSVAVCAAGVLAALTVEMGYLSLETEPQWAIASLSAVFILWRGVNPAWMVLCGALAGWAWVALAF